MSTAAAATPATAEPELPGLKPPPQTSARLSRRDTLHRQLAEGEPLGCAFVGRLLERPRLVDCPDGRALLRIVLRQHVMRHPQVVPLMATWDVAPHASTAVAHEAAMRLAAQWAPGTEVLLRGRGLEAAHLDGDPVLHVLDVLAVRALERVDAPAAADATTTLL